MSFLKNIWKANSKHKKLSEELALQSTKDAESDLIETVENENDVVIFKLKYLGSTVVEKITGENINIEAVKNIIKVTKAERKKIQRVMVAISLKGIAVTDLQGNDILKISIYRISNCSTDATHRQIFSFISTDTSETMECHAFVCSKRKTAETVTLAVAHAFSTAYEAWRVLPSTREFQKSVVMDNEKNTINQHQENAIGNHDTNRLLNEEKLIDFDDEPCYVRSPFDFGNTPSEQNSNPQWVCFEDDFVRELPQPSHNNIDLIFA